MKNYLFFIFATFCSLITKAQDFHFSQIDEVPALVNPALTGSDGLRASLNFKNQWKGVTTPFVTNGASFEARNMTVKRRAVTGGNTDNLPPSEKIPGKFAGGLSVFSDKAGDGRLKLTQTNLSLSTFVPTGEKSELSFGLQASLATRKINSPGFIYPNQFNGATYDPDIDPNENFNSDRFRYFDMGAGLMYGYYDEQRGLSNHKEVRARIGFGAYHLTSPKQKFLAKKSDKLYMKYVSHGDVLVSIPGTRTAISGSYLFQLQATTMEIVVGGMFRYYMKNDTRYTGYVKRTTIAGGIYFRMKDALIIKGLLEWEEQHAIGLSYDINVSKIPGLRGGLEFCYRYTSGHRYLYQKLK